MSPYPENFNNWPLEQRNKYFADTAREYRQRERAPTVLHRPVFGPTPRVTSAQAPAPAPPQGGSASSGPKPNVALVNAATIKPASISWLWNDYLARGKIHVLAGAPGTGKTTIAMALASVVTRGGCWPDGSRCPIQGRVVIWSGEDDPADTLVPRLIAAGAALSRVSLVGDVKESGKARPFDPARDIEPLREAIKQAGGAQLIIVDPVVSAVAGDSHKNAEVRRSLQPLVDLARDLGAALIGITHFSKATSGRDPVDRLNGSLAFGAIPRVVMVAAKRLADGGQGKDERFFCRAKSNNGPDGDGFIYDLVQSELDGAPGVSLRHRSDGSNPSMELRAIF
jgi:hypothetical protein